MSLQITQPPTVEPVTLQDVKDLLGLASAADDAKITRQITAAREFAEKVTRRSLCEKGYAFFLDRFPYPNDPLRVPVPPLLDLTAIKYLDNSLTQQTWDPSEYFVAGNQEPALVIPVPGKVWPCPARVPGAVELDFTAGYGAEDGPACPKTIAENIARLAVYLYETPEPVTEKMVDFQQLINSLFGHQKVYVF